MIDQIRVACDQVLLVRSDGGPSSLATALDVMHGLTDVVVLADRAALEEVATGFVPHLIAALHGVHAVTATRPVTDAVKRVNGVRVTASVDRSTLTLPQLPLVVRAEILHARRDLLLDVEGRDLCRRLLSAGYAVRHVAMVAKGELNADPARPAGQTCPCA